MRHRSIHRALTLLEVLAALVIITMLAGVCVPMLRSAAAVIGAPQVVDDSQVQLDLGLLADAFVKDSVAFGSASLDELTKAQIVPSAHTSFPEGSALGPITIFKVGAAGEDYEPEHDWVVFSDRDHLAIRFHALPAKAQSKERSP